MKKYVSGTIDHKININAGTKDLKKTLYRYLNQKRLRNPVLNNERGSWSFFCQIFFKVPNHKKQTLFLLDTFDDAFFMKFFSLGRQQKFQLKTTRI